MKNKPVGLPKLKELAQAVRVAEAALDAKFREEDRKPAVNQRALAPLQHNYNNAVAAFDKYCQEWLKEVLNCIADNLRSSNTRPFGVWSQSIQVMDIQNKPWYEPLRQRFENLHRTWQNRRQSCKPALNEHEIRMPTSA